MTPEKIQEIGDKARQDALEMSLRELREMLGKTQTEVAEATSLAQSELSRIERRDDHLLSTLRRIIEGMGGQLEVTAVFGEKRYPLGGV
jgi:transcriptional regulator with XRE-family HTH domain